MQAKINITRGEIMDVAFLLDKYFKGAENVSIDVFDALKQHTTFKGLNPLAERSVLVALQRRYKVIKG